MKIRCSESFIIPLKSCSWLSSLISDRTEDLVETIDLNSAWESTPPKYPPSGPTQFAPKNFPVFLSKAGTNHDPSLPL